MARAFDESTAPGDVAPVRSSSPARLGRIALAVAVAAVLLMLLYRWMLSPGGDLPRSEAPTFHSVRPFVLLAMLGSIVASLTLAAWSLSERGRPRLAATTALIVSVGLLVAWVTGIV